MRQQAATGALTYERSCARCGQPTFGVIGSVGVPGEPPEGTRAEAMKILATWGTFVCSTCDPVGKQKWLAEVAGKLGLRPPQPVSMN